MSEWNQLTKCVHAGSFLDEEVGGMTTPIYTSSSFRYRDHNICYPRYYNIPTQRAAAQKIAVLENGQAGLVVGSGMAAISSALLTFLAAGDHAVIQGDVYGGTFHFVEAEFQRLGLEYTLVGCESVGDFAAAIRDNTRVIYFETPTNPLLKVVDIRALAEMARSRGVITVIDNTFATPINQNPLDLGVDVVVHSGTKYLGGHSDLCCGAVVTRDGLMERVYETAVNHGGVLGAFECYRLERSLKTLGLRVRQQNWNALELARFLENRPGVRRVNYPGLAGHPGHETAKSQMRGFGGMLSVELEDDLPATLAVVGRLQVFHHAVSLGGVESLVCFPSLTSHAKVPPEDRKNMGITDTLIRVSVGIEDTDDLIADWDQALHALDG
ncbi:MAG: aminotransferase class I/II-fold pyridoxal phosphate-dependent enzyme [Thermodesulfobacteriota bacterium]